MSKPTASCCEQNVPNVLTFARLVAVPVLVAVWFAPLATAALWCAILFVAASFTDWLDGYIARKVRWGPPEP
jgi:phosphatidylglycerophosphate synthase